MSRPLLITGATGFVGKLTAQYLEQSAPEGARIALGGRSKEKLERTLSDAEFASWLMYPKVFTDFAAAQTDYGPVSVLPTS